MEDKKRILNREEISAEDKWATEDLYASDELWEKELDAVAQEQAVLASFAGRLGQSGKVLCEYMDLTEKLYVRQSRLANYCMRKADEDTREPKYQAMVGKYSSVMVALGAATSFDTPEIMALSDEVLEEFYSRCPGLERYRRYLTNLRRRKAHTLSPREEKLLSAAGEMAQAPDTIFSAFSDADMTFADAVDSRGNTYPVTQGTFVSLEESPDRQLRRSAYESLYDGFSKFRNTTAAILNAQNKQLKFFAEARNYQTARQAAMDRTNVPEEVYDNLIEAVHRNLEKMHRYVRLRKKALGLNSLHFYDVYTSLVSDVDRDIPFAEAKQTIYEALHPLGEEYRAILQEGFDSRWIDVYQNAGKRSGAYSAGAQVHPYVLMNYSGSLNSQFTLAHEMGHAIHSYLSNRHQTPLDSRYVIFVAEVASTCNEALLMEHLLSRTTDKKERAYLINHFLDQFKGTIYRQTMFAEFERTMGQLTAQGKTLTADVLSAEYKKLNEDYYGPDMVVDDRIAMEWARIPHFYYNYYVFQYATGYAAAIALSRRILSGEPGAVEAYLSFLSAGCTKSPIELLKDAGVDMTTPEPVEQALQLFGSLLDEMEALLEE